MKPLDVLFTVIICVQANSYDYSEYDYSFPEPGPPPASDLPPGYLEDIDGVDVYAQTATGHILGRRRTDQINMNAETNMVEWYLGIPYAEPPIGEYRFKAPVRKEPWRDTYRAVRQKSVCPQMPLYPYTDMSFQSEDCLYLNIFVPYKEDDANRTYPVMIYIHGGSYEYGASSVYNGNLLAQHGVVVVSINYRLGLLGFLAAKSKHLQGNYGLLDQIQALNWIKSNIASFRGDPFSTTVFGNSAGGSSIALLTLSPLARGLYNRVISQSGSPLSFWAIHNKTVNLRQHAISIMELFGCTQPTLKAKVSCLQKMDWRELINYNKMKVPNISPSEADFKPCIDGDVMLDVPPVLLHEGRINPVTFMTGTVKDEWTRNIGWFIQELYAEIPHLDDQFEDGIERSTFEQAIDHVITKRFGWSQTVADMVKNKYTDWTKRNDPIENRNQYVHFFTDLSMIAPTVATASYMHRHLIPVYMYTFNHHSQHADQNWWGSYHSVELNYIFGSPFTGFSVDTGTRQQFTEADKEVSKQMMVLWTNFAKYGDPTPAGFQEGFKWNRFLPSTSDYLHIASNSTEMKTHLRASTMAFWNELVQSMTVHKDSTVIEIKTYKVEMWIFVGISVILLFLLILALVAIVRNIRGNHYGIVQRTDQYNGAPVKV